MISSLLGAIMCAWASSMIGVNVKNTHTQRFDAHIEKGEILLMVNRLHPKAQLAGTEPQIPAFP